MSLTRILASAWLLATAGAPAVAAPGSLVIAGGGLKADNADVWRAFIDRVPSDRATIAIIPAASGEPAGSAAAARAALIGQGVAADRIEIVRLAMVDDPDTVNIDEAAWRDNANDINEINKIKRSGGIWFTGGDQARVIVLFGVTSGREAPMLTALRDRLAVGAVIGGTSAGAAIMSRPMIACGDPADAVLAPVSRDSADCAAEEGDREPLVLATGLGFLPLGLVDQHFSQRARHGRLLRAVACDPAAGGIGYGIDEDSALVVDLAHRQATVAGRGGVTVIDARHAKAQCTPFALDGATISRVTAGGTIHLP